MRLYRAEIDKTAIDELYHNEKLGFLELKRRVEARLGYPLFKRKLRRLSLHTFSSHLNKLLANNYIKKSGEGARGRNKTVDYSLTEKGKQEYRLKILRHKSNNKKDTGQRRERIEDKYRRSYRLLFLVDQVATGGELSTEEDLERFLTGIGKSRSDLAVDNVDRFRGKVKLIVTGFKPIQSIRIYKHERITNEGNQFIKYAYTHNGVSTSSVLKLTSKPDFLGAGDLTENEIIESINLLEAEGLLTKLTVGNGDVVYILTDSHLRAFTQDSFHILQKVFHNLIWRLFYVSIPTKDEIEWLKMLWGPTNTEKALREAYDSRHSLTKKKASHYTQIFKSRERLVNLSFYYLILELQAPGSTVIQKYRFPPEILLDIIYPKFIQIDKRSIPMSANLKIDYDYNGKRKYDYTLPNQVQ